MKLTDSGPTRTIAAELSAIWLRAMDSDSVPGFAFAANSPTAPHSAKVTRISSSAHYSNQGLAKPWLPVRRDKIGGLAEWKKRVISYDRTRMCGRSGSLLGATAPSFTGIHGMAGRLSDTPECGC